jgi:hypothetical protein
MIGRIITASTRPAVSMVRPVAETGPAKNGSQPSHSLSQVARPTEAGPSTDAPHNPDEAGHRGEQIDQVAQRRASRGGAKCVMNSATATASGVATTTRGPPTGRSEDQRAM